AGLVAKFAKALLAGDRAVAKHLLKQTAPLGSFVLVIGFVLPAFVPALSPVRVWMFNAMMVVLFVGLIATAQRAAIARLTVLTQRRSVHFVANATPGVLTLLFATRFLLRPERVSTDTTLDILILPFTVYLFSVGAVWLVCRMLPRKQRAPH